MNNNYFDWELPNLVNRIHELEDVNRTLNQEIERVKCELKATKTKVDWEKHVREVQTRNLLEGRK